MIAAVLHAAAGTPRAEAFPDPEPAPNEVVARVLAAGLQPLVRVHANGSHYTSTGVYPLVPGVDGVAELPDGRRAYVGFVRPPHGTFAERVAIDPTTAIPLPAGLAPAQAAGLVNPAMSSWLALHVRAHLRAGEHVAILGATGASGQLAVQVARALGAGRVVAAGRNADILGRLGADAVLRTDAPGFADDFGREAAVDVVLDYLWGPVAEAALGAILANRKALAGRPIRYVNIGESAGARASLSPHVLRSMDVTMLGSGIGSVSIPHMRAEIPSLLDRAARGELTLAIREVPLAQVGDVWTTSTDAGARVVIVP
jgi:NADPH:quinone reductase-like Zn-dependent oxidoreductase